MPKQLRQEPFPQTPSPMKQGESWQGYIKRLRAEQDLGPAQIAGIMTASTLMRRTPGAPADQRLLETLGGKLLGQPSFRSLSKDPEALRLARAGKGAELIVRMEAYRARAESETAAYARKPEQTEADARVLRTAMRSMKDSFASKPAAQREREGRYFREMLRRMQHAASLSEQGLALDAKTAKALADSVRRYVDGGTRFAGGKRPAAAFRQSMCVLKQFIPEKDFRQYCGEIDRVRKTRLPNYHRNLNPGDFTEDLLSGESRTAREYMQAAQRRMLKNGATLDGCAVVAAVMELCGGNPNAVIRKSDLQSAVNQLEKPGTAFMRVMEDEDARSHYSELASNGNVMQIGLDIIGSANRHSARAAQWQMDRAMKKAGQEKGGMSTDRLADILAARAVATAGKAGQPITNGAFRALSESIRNSEGFSRLAAQYRSDPGLRGRIDRGFAAGDAGKTLEQEYAKTTAQPQRRADQEVVPAARL